VPDLTVHERHEDLRGVNLTGPNFKQLTIQYDEIAELADLDRADPVIEPELIRRSQSASAQRLVQRDSLVERDSGAESGLRSCRRVTAISIASRGLKVL
jgi:hypothetical protein